MEKTTIKLIYLYQVFLFLLGFGLLFGSGNALADTMPTLIQSFAGNVNFVGTEKTLRTQPNGSFYNSACSVVSGSTTASGSATTTAALAGIPGGATVTAAYLYWAGSSSTPDYNVIFEGNAITADRQYTSTASGDAYFSGVADVTGVVAAKGNGSYSFAGLTINNTANCSTEGVVGGWALLVIYSAPSEEFRVLNLYEGFQYFQNSSITLNLSNFKIPDSFTKGRHAHITWEGDPTLSGGGENITFNGTTLSDSTNPVGNQFNSASTIVSPPDTASYGVDFDVYDLTAPVIKAGDTTAATVYSSGQDLVLLSAEIIAIPNVPVADLSLAMTRNSALDPGQSATYTLDVRNNGPRSESGPITVTDTLPVGLTYSSFSGSGWTSCKASGQVVTCTYGGSLASGASASPLTLTVSVASNASGTKTNTATVSGTAFDNIASNNSASDSYTFTSDLAISMARGGALTPGSNAVYTLYVSNGGPNADAGPITVTDTLPAGLSYVSASGTGWTCSANGQSANGQVVTCTRSGSFPSGTAAPPLALTVAVSATASGAITNSATVAGVGVDNNTANNTATDSYVFSPYAYYAMDESSWGTVLDSSGNVRNGSKLGTAAPTGYPPTIPPGSAISGNPGTCGSGTIPGTTNTVGMDTGIDVNNIGNAGTIAFWYRSNTAWDSNSSWDDGSSRMLFDASTNLGNSTADKTFYLVKRYDGRLMFTLQDSRDNTSTATSPPFSFAANTWHHIAVSWDLAANRLYIYVDGNATPVASSNSSVNGTLGNVDTLYFGTRRSSNVTGTAGFYTSNSANGSIDEVYIFNSAINGTGVSGLKNLTHACAPLINHYELSLPTDSITCLPVAVTVTACADSSSPCTNRYTAVSGQTATLAATGGMLGAATLVFGANGLASTTLSYPTANNGTPVSVTLSGEQSTAINARQCCPNGSSCTVANSCSTTFSTAGFIFANAANGNVDAIPSQVAGVSSGTQYLRAVKTNTVTKACESALTGVRAINFGYECNNPATCSGSDLMSINGSSATTITRNNNAKVSVYTPVNLTFDANGSAPFTLNYSDVGQTTLWASTIVNGATLSGSSNPFVTKPYSFVLSGIQQTAAPNLVNPAAQNATDPKFIRAGENFSVTVTAVNANGNPTPNYGKEITPESVKLTSALVPGLGLINNPNMGGSFGAFNGGGATGTAFTWGEVGIITITPSVGDGDYLGAGDTLGTSSRVGRFIPDRFVATPTLVNRSGFSCTPASTFTYLGEPLTLRLSLTATNVSGGTTQNYAGGFVKLDPTVFGNWKFAAVDRTTTKPANAPQPPYLLTPLITATGLPAATCGTSPCFNAGVAANIAVPFMFNRNALTPVGDFASVDIGIDPMDTDGVTVVYDIDAINATAGAFNRRKVGQTALRYGRLRIDNAYGSEQLPLPVQVEAQYWNGTSYVRNTNDLCTPLTAANFGLASHTGGINPSNMNMTSNFVGAGTLNGGLGRISLARPTTAVTIKGSVTLSSTMPFLPGAGRETFGIYRNGPVIYIREIY